MQQPKLFTQLAQYCQLLETEFHLIPSSRQTQLFLLRNYIAQKIANKETPQLIVICTHNSRRSHIGQLWLAIAATYYGLPPMATFSGGTEATAFNSRAVEAFKKTGLAIGTSDVTASNPIYEIKWTSDMPPYLAFSKKYNSAPNPTKKFAAIMVCTHADEGCPLVVGSDFRLSLPYNDPKAFDETPIAAIKYSEKVSEIGREVLFALSKI